MKRSSSLAVVAAALALFPALGARARDLTFEDRVRAQEAIERVYYSHQIGATRPFEQAVPREVLVRKVRATLRESAAIEKLWGTTVTAEALERETRTLIARTRMPERLREISAALGNDPFLLQECFARPVLIDRLARAYFAQDARLHGEERKRDFEGWLREQSTLDEWNVVAVASPDATFSLSSGPDATFSCLPDDSWTTLTDDFPARTDSPAIWTGTRMIFWGGLDGAALGDGVQYDPVSDTRTPISSVNAPERRYGHTMVWTGSRAIVWGGYGGAGTSHYFNDGASYDPATDTWTSIAVAGAPQERRDHQALWTGSRMIVWGGTTSSGAYVNTGGRYDPASDSWTATSTVNAPAGRREHGTVWTGSLMVVWGGYTTTGVTNTGGRYNPGTDTWTATTTTGALQARYRFTTIWTGTQMIVWAGRKSVPDTHFNDGARYNPVTDAWVPMSLLNAPVRRSDASAVWTGTRMVVWGGEDNDGIPVASGGQYDPTTNTWTATSVVGAPAPRESHLAVWTGSRLIVWGGFGGSYLNDGGRYDPSADAWTPIAGTYAPRLRASVPTIWTGNMLLTWGGDVSANPFAFEETGERYDPLTRAFTPLPAQSFALPRTGHTIVWTGWEMIVLGGFSKGVFFSGGARYDPMTDGWSPMAPLITGSRTEHSAVWTGTAMIVWGGRYSTDGLDRWNTGGRYDPYTDSWTATSTVGVPKARYLHSAAWNGTAMIVWGGAADTSLNTGGRYDPVNDTWSATSTVGAPDARRAHSAFADGSRMIVWGGRLGSGIPYFDTGGIYDPATDSWSPTSVVGAPTPRSEYGSAWTGTEMVVWGGADSTFNALGTGARYSPATNAWTPMSVSNAPSPRTAHAVWTGTGVLVWDGTAVRGGTYAFHQSVDDDGDGFSECTGDCDDADAAVSPQATEICDNVDNDCNGLVDDGSVAPGSSSLELQKSGFDVILTWAPVQPGGSYQVVEGTLDVLIASGGDFAQATTACLASTTATDATSVSVPAPGDGVWMLMRASNRCAPGSYDEESGSQQGSRDAEIAASPNTCP